MVVFPELDAPLRTMTVAMAANCTGFSLSGAITCAGKTAAAGASTSERAAAAASERLRASEWVASGLSLEHHRHAIDTCRFRCFARDDEPDALGRNNVPNITRRVGMNAFDEVAAARELRSRPVKPPFDGGPPFSISPPKPPEIVTWSACRPSRYSSPEAPPRPALRPGWFDRGLATRAEFIHYANRSTCEPRQS